MIELDQNLSIDAAVLDFSKAFDKVPHQRLISKLNYYGIAGPISNWIKHFLVGRTQKVLVDGATSTQVPVPVPVPQSHSTTGHSPWPSLFPYIHQ